jgi:hypothetical protein
MARDGKMLARGLAVVVMALAVILTGCAAQYLADVRPPQGILFSSFKAPLTTDFHNTSVSADLKMGKKKSYYFYDPLVTRLNFAWGDVDVPDIARMAGINEVSYAECELMSILGIYAEFTVYVYGR